MLQTLQAIRTEEAKATAFREISGKFLDMDKPDIPLSLTKNLVNLQPGQASVSMAHLKALNLARDNKADEESGCSQFRRRRQTPIRIWTTIWCGSPIPKAMRLEAAITLRLTRSPIGKAQAAGPPRSLYCRCAEIALMDTKNERRRQGQQYSFHHRCLATPTKNC